MENTQIQTKPKQHAAIKDLLRSDKFRHEVSQALPKHLTPDRFIRVALTALTRTPKLAQCDQYSFFNALMTLSQLGLEPDGRRAHLIPFENRKRNTTEVQLIIDYKGLAELVMRSGCLSRPPIAQIVCERDEFVWDTGRIVSHKVDWKQPRGNVYAVYAIAHTKDGGEISDVMTREEVEAVRGRSRAANNGPWVTDWNEMAKKTVFRRLTKWLPISPEIEDAAHREDGDRVDVSKPAITSPGLMLPEPPSEDEQAEADAGLAPEKPATEIQAPAAQSMPEVSIHERFGKEVLEVHNITFEQFANYAESTGNIPGATQMTCLQDMDGRILGRLLRAKDAIVRAIKGTQA